MEDQYPGEHGNVNKQYTWGQFGSNIPSEVNIRLRRELERFCTQKNKGKGINILTQNVRFDDFLRLVSFFELAVPLLFPRLSGNTMSIFGISNSALTCICASTARFI